MMAILTHLLAFGIGGLVCMAALACIIGGGRR